MKRFVLRFVLLLVLCSVLASFPEINVAQAEPKTIVVPDDYPTIGAAIGAASEGDTIFVKKGTYNENLLINKSLSLIGEDKETTTIDGGEITTVVKINQDWVNMSGFMIRNSGKYSNGGICLLGSDYCNISGNRVTTSSYGIKLIYSSNNIIVGNILDNTGAGIELSGVPGGRGSDYNSIHGNEVVNNQYGISIMYSQNNTLYENNIANNFENGIHLLIAYNNSIIGNNITNSGQQGIMLTYSSNNIFYHNNFVNNIQVVDGGWIVPPWIPNSSVNIWDDGYPSGGNYWSDYEDRYPNAKELDNSGIWDTPYVIYGKNQDNYPLMHYWIPSPTISIISPENKMYTVNHVSLKFTLSEPTSWIAYSLDGQANVTIAGNTTLTGLSDGSHNLIVYARDAAGNTGTSEIIYFSVKTQQSEPFPITWVVTAIVIIAVVGAALLVYFAKVKKTTGKAE